MDIWKPIKDFEHYEVSNIGNIKRVTKGHQKKAGDLISQYKRGNGYLQVILHKHGWRKRYLTHRLVANAFHGEGQSPYHEVAHLNGIRDDNRLENLAWKTHKENELDKHGHGTVLRGSQVATSKLIESQVIEIKSLIKHKKTLKQIAELYGVSVSLISLIRGGKSWRHV